MSAAQVPAVNGSAGGMNLESVNKISQLPVVESTIGLASDMYRKVKDSNAMVSAALGAAESTAQTAVNKAVEVGRPVAARLQGPIQRVDSALCTGIDYVESKVPAVKLPPKEMYDRVMGAVCSVCGYGMQKINEVGQLIGKTASAATGGDGVRAQCPQCAQAQAERERKLAVPKSD
ncbi:Lipid storage droplets surface-binding protein 1 [Frankliniella fusca]|uniref:Lipid storage droplets surface-binding protein 1 n=1 Tax=Frankliniella fusca TaxID=407009 RepID=A0AAE1I1F2_9NEOP|nr:Lipid storage droplets surface-binding protein 1 [Frankliniella fusca]